MNEIAFFGTVRDAWFHGMQKLMPSKMVSGATPCDGCENDKRSEHLIMLGVGLTVFAVYWQTLCTGVYPGTSAVATGKVLGLLPDVPVSHPIWLAMSRAVANLPGFIAPYRLNLFNAVCGSMAAAWLFQIVKRTMFELIRAAPVLRFVPVSDDETDTAREQEDGNTAVLTVDPQDDAKEHVVATLGGLCSALVFAFCAPFWIASTSLHVQPFDILLLFLTADLLARYHFTGKLGASVAAVFLCGAGLIESPIFLILSPVFAAVVILTCIRNNQISEPFFLLLLAAGLMGVAASLALFFSLSAAEQVVSTANLSQLIQGFARTYRAVLVQGVPRTDVLFVLFLPLLSLVASIVGTRKITFCRDAVTRWKWMAINVIFTAAMVAGMLNLPKTVWGVARDGSHLPILPSLVVAVAVGFFFVFWYQMGTVPTYDDARELEQSQVSKRLAGYGMCGLLVIMALRATSLNLGDSDGRKAAFADRIAQEMLALSKPARCIVTDGTLDLNLLIRTHVTGRRLTIIPACSDHRVFVAKTRGASTTARLTMAPPAGELAWEPEALVEQWLRNNPTEHTQVTTVGIPELWHRAGTVPLPNGLLYIGASQAGAPDLSTLMDKQREVWQLIAPLLKDDPAMLPALRRTQAGVRAHVSRVANDLGVHLENAGHLTEADSAYTMSLTLEEKNLSAILNRYGLRLRQPVAGPVSEAVRQILQLVEKPQFFEEFDVAVARSGTLVPQLADKLVPRVMANYPSGETPPSNLIKLLDKWLTFSCATPVTTPLTRTMFDVHHQLSQALQARVEGRNDEAEAIVRRIVRVRTSNLPAWSLLAEILLDRGEVNEVRDNIFPAMRALAGGVTNSLVEMTQGCLCMRAEPPRYDEARVCFERALALDPSLAIACDQLLQADVCLGTASFIEADAKTIIKRNPTHAAATALLGNLSLGQKRLGEAESYLRTSLACQPSAGAHNDLSELFCQQNNWAEAEQQARLAIRLEPGFYQAWGSLGKVLMDRGRLDEAYAALRCALVLRNSAYDQGGVSQFRLRLNQDRSEVVNQLFTLVEKRLLNVPEPVREVFSDLKKNILLLYSSDWSFIAKKSIPLAYVPNFCVVDPCLFVWAQQSVSHDGF